MVHYLNYFDNKRRKGHGHCEFKLNVYKSFFFDKRVKFSIRFITRSRIFYYKKYKSICFIRNRCLMTGRTRFILRYFGLSRMSFKNRASVGFLTGVKRI